MSWNIKWELRIWSTVLEPKADAAKPVAHAIKTLLHPQLAWLLTCFCLVPTLNHLLRRVPADLLAQPHILCQSAAVAASHDACLVYGHGSEACNQDISCSVMGKLHRRIFLVSRAVPMNLCGRVAKTRTSRS